MKTPLEWIPGMKHMRLKDMPSFVRSTDPKDIAFNRWLEEAQDNLKSDAIVINTFEDFESEVLEALASMFPNIYSIGPLSLQVKSLPKNIDSDAKMPSLWKENTECLAWLDKQKPDSTVYINFGSIAMMTEDNLKEFAWGLANSGHPFLWILRNDVVQGSSAVLPLEFLEETKDRGLIVNWVPQEKVLKHPSVGAFLTHSGWNSTLEGICGGVPMICWPFFAEQQVNCRYACTTWGIGLEINSVVKREEVCRLVKEMMEEETGKIMRKKAKEWKRKADEAVGEGGSACKDFNHLVMELQRLSFNGR